jgi:hypothetical protein
MGARGWARVTAIEPCPELEDGPGRWITGIFEHSRGQVYELTVAGEPKPIGVTGRHPFWSADRQRWVAVAELRPGERLQARDGSTPCVEGLTLCGGPEPVYNIEVEGDHCYRVGQQGLLVHNLSNACHLFSPQYFGVGGSYCTPGGPKYNTDPATGRAEKSEARVCSTGGGSAAGQDPVGWNPAWNQGLPPGKRRVARCHLLGDHLGGAGTKNNLVPCCHKKNRAMELVELQVGAFITKHGCADVQVIAHYDTPGRLIPSRIEFLAKAEDSSTGACKVFTFTLVNPSGLTQCPVV